MKIAIAGDHAGYEEKERLKPLLEELGVHYEDLGTVSEESQPPNKNWPAVRRRPFSLSDVLFAFDKSRATVYTVIPNSD